MRWWQRLSRWSERERRLDAELRDHVERLVADAVAAGMSEREARRNARLAFGGVEQVKEACRDVRPLRMLDDVRQDVRYALRSLRRTPGFAAVAVLTLGLGIGASTAIFSVVDAVVLRALPFDHPDRLVAVGRRAPAPAGGLANVTTQDLAEWTARQTVFDGLAGFRTASATLLEGGDDPEALGALSVSSGFFDVLRAPPVLGRAFTDGEHVDGRETAAVIGYGLWQRRYGGTPDVIGRSILIDGTPHEVVGVAPPGFSYPGGSDADAQVILPLALLNEERVNVGGATVVRAGFLHGAIGRLQDGISFDEAAAEMDRLGGAAVPLHEDVVGVRTRAWMRLLLGAVLCVLLVACANVASLLLARASTREREIALRTAIGAGRWRVARQLLTEALVLSSAGTVAGVAVAWWGVDILRTTMPDGVPRAASIALDLRVLAAAAGAAIATGLLVGALPAAQHSRPDLARTLHRSTPGAAAGGTLHRSQRALVIAELALAVTLVVGAGLFVTSFVKLMAVDLGFEPEDVLTAVVAPPAGAAARAQTSAALVDIADRVAQLPRVEYAAAVAGTSPVTTRRRTFARIVIPGRTIDPGDAEPAVAAVTADYHRALRIPLRSGRYFDAADRDGRQAVALLGQESARRYFPGEDPVGQFFVVAGQTREVVGVVGDVRSAPEDARLPLVYVPLAQGFMFASSGEIVVRTSAGRPSIASAVQAVVSSILPGVPVREVQAFTDIMRRRTAQRRLSALLVGLFGALGLVVAAVGVYGLLAFMTAQRTSEIGVRRALGATRAQVIWMVLRQAAMPALCGLAIGTGAAWALSSTAEAFLFEIEPTDLRVFAGALAALAVAICAASAVPAWRAATVDPVTALRHE